MGVEEHRTHARAEGPIAFAVLTVSDRRTEATDSSGRLVRELMAEAGTRWPTPS